MPLKTTLRCPPIQTALMSLLTLLSVLSLSGCHQEWATRNDSNTQAKNTHTKAQCQRVVSLSPSITEVLYALHLEDRLVGVTRFCHYPAQARQKPKVGGYLDPDLEALLRLKPDTVMVREEQSSLAQKIRSLGITVFPVNHRSTQGILDSFIQIGQLCHTEALANASVQGLKTHVQTIQHKTANAKTRPRVLLVVDRDIQSDTIRWVYAAGTDGFYNHLIAMAGGVNVFSPAQKGFLQISAESILRLNPDVIIEILPVLDRVSNSALSNADAPNEKTTIRQAETITWRSWQKLSRLKALQNHRIYLLSQDYMNIPGPRFWQALEQFAQVIHPELHWSNVNPTDRPSPTRPSAS